MNINSYSFYRKGNWMCDTFLVVKRLKSITFSLQYFFSNFFILLRYKFPFTEFMKELNLLFLSRVVIVEGFTLAIPGSSWNAVRSLG